VLALVGVNIYSSLTWRVEHHVQETVTRIESLERGSGSSAICVLTGRDELLDVFYDPGYSTDDSFPVVVSIVPTLAAQASQWRQNFSRRAEGAWGHNGEVWVTKRAWSNTPRRDWLWVENDSPVKWKQLSDFVTRLATDADEGGPDGFVRVANTAFNRDAIKAVVPH
jgi:hypothetical protein